MQIVLFLIFVLLVLLAIVSKKNAFSKNQKIIVTSVVAVFAIMIYIFESAQTNSALKDRDVVNAFRQGKILTCKEYKVDKNRYIYVSGTQTFMPNKYQTTLEGVIIKVSTCKED